APGGRDPARAAVAGAVAGAGAGGRPVMSRAHVATPPFMAAAPTVGALPPLDPPRPTRFTLSHGLEGAAGPRHAAPIVAVTVMLRTGSDTDPPETAGLAASTADMLDEGAGARDTLSLAEELERLGADLGVGCGRDGSQLSLQVPSAGLSPALAIVG